MTNLLQQVLDKAEELLSVYNQYRVGQALMNALGEISPRLYREITATDADCFYVDSKIIKFIEKIIIEMDKTNYPEALWNRYYNSSFYTKYIKV